MLYSDLRGGDNGSEKHGYKMLIPHAG